ncbi:hypothetical protein P7C70_g6016, partial [Phenoliferia sp. Uapishka_3]
MEPRGDYGVSLRKILEDARVTKLIYDVREAASALFAVYSISLGGVYDVMLHELSYRQLSHPFCHRTEDLLDLEEAIQHYLEVEPSRSSTSSDDSVLSFDQPPPGPHRGITRAQSSPTLSAFSQSPTSASSFAAFTSSPTSTSPPSPSKSSLQRRTHVKKRSRSTSTSSFTFDLPSPAHISRLDDLAKDPAVLLELKDRLWIPRSREDKVMRESAGRVRTEERKWERGSIFVEVEVDDKWGIDIKHGWLLG